MRISLLLPALSVVAAVQAASVDPQPTAKTPSIFKRWCIPIPFLVSCAPGTTEADTSASLSSVSVQRTKSVASTLSVQATQSAASVLSVLTTASLASISSVNSVAATSIAQASRASASSVTQQSLASVSSNGVVAASNSALSVSASLSSVSKSQASASALSVSSLASVSLVSVASVAATAIPLNAPNLGYQTFYGHLGGLYASPVNQVGTGYIAGLNVLNYGSLSDALTQSCDDQLTACNLGSLVSFQLVYTLPQCKTQYTQCLAAIPAGVAAASQQSLASVSQTSVAAAASQATAASVSSVALAASAAASLSRVAATSNSIASVSATSVAAAASNSLVAQASKSVVSVASVIATAVPAVIPFLGLQTFYSNVGAIYATPVLAVGNTFVVGLDTFSSLSDALTKSCKNQNVLCATGATLSFQLVWTVAQCSTQNEKCLATIPASISQAGQASISLTSIAAQATASLASVLNAQAVASQLSVAATSLVAQASHSAASLLNAQGLASQASVNSVAATSLIAQASQSAASLLNVQAIASQASVAATSLIAQASQSAASLLNAQAIQSQQSVAAISIASQASALVYAASNSRASVSSVASASAISTASVASQSAVSASQASQASVSQAQAASVSNSRASIASNSQASQSALSASSVSSVHAQSAQVSASAASVASVSATSVQASQSQASLAAISISQAQDQASRASASQSSASVASVSSVSATSVASAAAAASASASAVALPSPYASASAALVAEGTDGRALTGASTSSSSMTPVVCAQYCTAAGFAISGTEYSSECFCGNSFSNGASLSLTSSNSHMACSGDSTQTCGSASALSVVYNTNLATLSNGVITLIATPSSSSAPPAATSSAASTPSTSTKVSLSNGYSSDLHCYSELPGRALTEAGFSSNDMTYLVCTTFCSNAGFSVAGVEYGRECYCASTLPALADNGNCYMPCSGDSTATCGGPQALQIFTSAAKTDTSTTLSSGWTSAPLCLAEPDGSRLLTDASYEDPKMTVESCTSFCSSKGSNIAGLEYATQCFCGSSTNVDVTTAAKSTNCNMAAGGAQTELAGGPNALSIWTLPTQKIRRRLLPIVNRSH